MSSQSPVSAGKTNGAELGEFLRKRRERLRPADVGIASTRPRRTPGLRREEVAFLADIGVKWYTRLEMGEATHPSQKTLIGIAQALHFSKTDTDYIFELAGISKPLEQVDQSFDVPEVVSTFVTSMRGIMARVSDMFLTPLRWNAIADAVWGYSSLPSPLERNSLFRAFGDASFMHGYAGDEYETVVRNAVSVFRRNYSSEHPTPFARQLYERLQSSKRFNELWDARTVRDEFSDEVPMIRHHAKAGTLTMLPLDLTLPHRQGLVLKLWFAADDDTRAKFSRLEEMGRPWTPDDA